jgi:hypothetical protein
MCEVVPFVNLFHSKKCTLPVECFCEPSCMLNAFLRTRLENIKDYFKV